MREKRDHNLVLELHAKGLTLKDIVKETGYPYGTVSYILSKNGLKANRKKTVEEEYEEEYLDELKEYICEGYSVSEFCEIKELSYSSMYNVAKKHDLISVHKRAPRHSERLSKTNTKFTLDKDVLERLYHIEKHNLYEIAEMYEVSPATVLNRMKKFGIERRNKSEAGTLSFENNPERRVLLREISTQLYLDGVLGNYKDTWIERKFEDWCIENNIKYKKQFRINGKGHPYDFLICGFDLLVELDGEYWHSKPEQVEKDKLHESMAEEHGFVVIRFTDKEIADTDGECFLRVLNELENRRTA